MATLAFDIGIKNLAYCIYDPSSQTIHAIENVNLMAADEVEHILCAKDHKVPTTATYASVLGPTCKRHVPDSHPILTGTLQILKATAKEKGIVKGKMPKKENLLTLLKTAYSLPVIKAKKPKAAAQSLETLHDALRQMVLIRETIFNKSIKAVLLENQPAFKNPHMKSVQVLLFAVLRDWFLTMDHTPSYHLVHAKKKVQDAASGDAGYADRKRGSDERARILFENPAIKATEEIRAVWQTAKKKSDMSDALCMCVDFKA